MSEKKEVSEKMQKLIDLGGELSDLGHIGALMGWDQQVYMPNGGAQGRGMQSSVIGKIMHEKFTSDEVGQLIADVAAEVGDLDADTDEARSVKVVKRQYEKQTKVPLPMLMEQIQVTSMAHLAWVEAKEKSDFSIFEPHLSRIMELSKEYADLFKPYDHVYDPLLD